MEAGKIDVEEGMQSIEKIGTKLLRRRRVEDLRRRAGWDKTNKNPRGALCLKY